MGAITVLLAIAGGFLAWHRRLSSMETKVNIMFTWWVKQMPNVDAATMVKFFNGGKDARP